MMNKSLFSKKQSSLLALNIPSRHFYFSVPKEKNDNYFYRNVDFPMNLGFNNYELYKHLTNQIMSPKSKVSLAFRNKRLLNQFRILYIDLLKGISDMNYESIQ